jgi:hypothetical protein
MPKIYRTAAAGLAFLSALLGIATWALVDIAIAPRSIFDPPGWRPGIGELVRLAIVALSVSFLLWAGFQIGFRQSRRAAWLLAAFWALTGAMNAYVRSSVVAGVVALILVAIAVQAARHRPAPASREGDELDGLDLAAAKKREAAWADGQKRAD